MPGIRKNFMLDQEAAELLDDHPEDNHSELVRELLKEYYTAGVYDTEQAGARMRKRELERQESELSAELDSIREEREQLAELAEDSDGETDIEAVATEVEIIDPSKATASNPGIRRKAKENGIDPNVLADVVREQSIERRRSEGKPVLATGD